MILIVVSTVFPASGRLENVPSPPSGNPQLLRRFVFGPLLSSGLSASCSCEEPSRAVLEVPLNFRATVEAAPDGVDSAFAT
jgi:hypothetical protein